MKSLNLNSRFDADSQGINHILHLYTPKVDKYAIQGAFLTSIRNDDVIYVTVDSLKSPIREFSFPNVTLNIIKPEDLRALTINEEDKMRIIIDVGSITDRKRINEIYERESYINELGKKHHINCLCTYDVSKLNPETIKRLSAYHNQLRLTTSDLTVLSGDFVDKSKLSDDFVEKMVKDNLETIMLALIQKKPMCGTDIIGAIHLEFNVLLSPGTIYPLLHSLKEKGLLTFKKHGKVKTYTPAEDAEMKIRSLLIEQIQARNLLNSYLQHETTI